MIRENNHRAHPLGVIQVKKDSSNKIMLRSEGKLMMGWECAWKYVEQYISGCHNFVFGVNIVLVVAEN